MLGSVCSWLHGIHRVGAVLGREQRYVFKYAELRTWEVGEGFRSHRSVMND